MRSTASQNRSTEALFWYHHTVQTPVLLCVVVPQAQRRLPVILVAPVFQVTHFSSSSHSPSALPCSHSSALLFCFFGSFTEMRNKPAPEADIWVGSEETFPLPDSSPLQLQPWPPASPDPPSSCSPTTQRSFYASKSFGDLAASPEGEQFGSFSAVQASTARTGILCSRGWDLVGVSLMSKPGWMGH